MTNSAQLREVFHFCFLEQLFKISDPTLYVLKGGVNLRFFFGSPRYSEDMDLDVVGGQVQTLKKSGYKILENKAFQRVLRTYGIEDLNINDPAKAKQTETTQRFRVGLVTRSGERLPTKVEFSRRVEKEEFLLERVQPEVARAFHRLAYSCQHYTGGVAIFQKIRALAQRPQTQARDVFDLSLLISSGYAKDLAISKAISRDKIQLALANLGSLTYEDFQGQVVEFLEESAKTSYTSKGSWQKMKEDVEGVLHVL